MNRLYSFVSRSPASLFALSSAAIASAWFVLTMGYFLKKYWKITVNTANRPSQLVVVAKPGMYLGASLDGQSQVE